MEKVYILGGLRTPIVLKNGAFQQVQPEDFGAAVLRALLQKYKLDHVDAVICGNAVGTGGNMTRLMALKAGLPAAVPAFTVDMQCASAALSLELAQAKIASGQADLIIAGGLESASLQPLRAYHPKDHRYDEQLRGEYQVAQFSPEEPDPLVMLRGAERTAQTEQISRQELEEWALLSHQRAAVARKAGILQELIVPVAGQTEDDGIREKMSQRLLARLPLLLGEKTSLTAGTSCLINDGAALIAVCSERYWKAQGVRPIARLSAALSCGGDPLESPRGAMAAADALLKKQGLSYDELTAIEFNEAFAVIDVLFARRFPGLTTRYNSFGGALAYGHPYGASGAVILLHLLKALEKSGGGLGLCSIAGAGGLGTALLTEWLS